MNILKPIYSLGTVILLFIVFQFSVSVFAQSELPTSEMPIRVFHGQYKPFAGDSLIQCPECDKNTYSEETKDTEIFNEKNRPDTLYSWTKIEWARGRFESLQVEKWQGMWRPLFLTRAPLSSYPYGDVSLRIKLRAGIKFKREKTHCEVPVAEAESTIYMFSGMMNEFLICSPKVIESISISTKEHYDEMVRDYLQHKLNPESASYYMRIGNSKDNGFFNSHEICPDSVCYKEEKLISNLKITLQLISNNRSQILFNPDLPAIKRTVKEHFSTTSPIYFNANQLY